MTTEKKVRSIVMKRIQNFKGYVAFSFFMAIVIQLIALIPPLVMQTIIDKYIVEKDMLKTFIGILVCVFVPIVSTMFTTFYNYKLNAVGRNMGAELTLLAGEKLVYQPVSFFEDKQSSELASYCRSESMKYIVFWMFDMPELAASLMTGIVIFFYIINANILSGISLLLYIPMMLLPSNYFAKKAQGYIENVVENNGKTLQLFNDTFRGIKFVKAAGLEQFRLNKIKNINKETVSIWAKMTVLDNLSGMWTNSIMDKLFTGIVFGIAVIAIMKGKGTIGNLLVLLNYLPLLFDVIRKAAQTNFKFKQQLAEYDKLFELIVMSDERDYKSERKAFSMEQGLKVKNISFRYKEDEPWILQNASLSVNKGEWVGIIGESGAGKSTLFQLLIRLYHAYSGEIKIDDTSIYNIDINDLRNNVSFISQDTVLFPGTLKENLCMVKPDVSEDEIKDIIKKVGLWEFVSSKEEGLDMMVGENGITLSGGQKQRIGLAQGLLRKSKLLLLDEVTANVDSKTEEDIRNLIYKLKQEKDVTVISISHRLNFLNQADKIFELKNGAFIEQAGL